jgi:NitT/TauT family transport system permease protein
MKRALQVVAPALFIALLLGVWEAACRLLAVPTYFLPTPSEIGVALVSNAGLLFVSAGRTLAAALIAFALVSALANLAAVGAASSRIVEASFRPIAVALQVTPIVALAPLFAVWAGVDHPERAVVSLAVVVGFFPIYSGTLAGLGAVDPELERLFDLYGATGWQRLTRLRAPSAIPQALEGEKVGLGLALVGAVMGELSAGSGSTEGLAWRIVEASHRLEMAKSFAALVALALLGGALYVGFQAFERRALAWWRGRPITQRR